MHTQSNKQKNYVTNIDNPILITYGQKKDPR